MTAAIKWLCERGIAVKRTSEIHLKIGALNFYPDSGTLYFDGARKLSEHGLDGLKSVLGRLMPNTSPRDEIVEISIE